MGNIQSIPSGEDPEEQEASLQDIERGKARSGFETDAVISQDGDAERDNRQTKNFDAGGRINILDTGMHSASYGIGLPDMT